MRRDEFYVEELLCNDAAKIVIDEEFKNDLKNRIMFGDKYNNITQLPKRKNNFKQNRYLKIASGFVICVFVSGTIFKTIDAPNKDILARGELIMPIDSSKNSVQTDGEKTDVIKPLGKIIKTTKETKQPSVAKEGVAGTSDSPLVNNVEEANADANINKNINKANPEESDAEINDGLVKVSKTASVSTEGKSPIDVPTMEIVKDDVGENLKCYDSRYSFDEKRLVSVKDGGIYIRDIESSKEKKLISYNQKTQIVDKPNFTLNDGIIYYKAEKTNLENGAIYLSDKNGQDSIKIVNGKNPMISKDGKKLVYEAEGKIYILTLATNTKSIVDIGKYPAWADNGNLISYVKEDSEKRFSSLWVFDLVNENTRSLTNNEGNIKNNSIESWAEAVRSENISSNYDATSKYSYFESIWSSSSKEIYVIRKNNEAQVFEFIRFNLDK